MWHTNWVTGLKHLLLDKINLTVRSAPEFRLRQSKNCLHLFNQLAIFPNSQRTPVYPHPVGKRFDNLLEQFLQF